MERLQPLPLEMVELRQIKKGNTYYHSLEKEEPPLETTLCTDRDILASFLDKKFFWRLKDISNQCKR